ncbi:hypothetical protein BLNAU_6993 [Blattamonas nauphoetae]|uniref:Secreted protein n=1 Tax=Blattamonas nauphoetae TaxID=2049346 RepID=A0ABQ9Y2U6_9EUKA|nr:hypothetical protein BLNAU_6993 [Blattamonas nauphoetae]
MISTSKVFIIVLSFSCLYAELRDLTLAEAFRPTLTTTIANQIRDSPQIWYGFRAGLNEKSIHICKYSQSDHVKCRLIVDEKTLDCLVIEAKESGHLAELTGYDSCGTVEEEEYRRGRHTDEGGEEEERGEVVVCECGSDGTSGERTYLEVNHHERREQHCLGRRRATSDLPRSECRCVQRWPAHKDLPNVLLLRPEQTLRYG